jgi:hypothetical protein
VPDGTIGSFTAQLVVDGAFDAFVPPGWIHQSAVVFGAPFSLEVDGFAEASLSRGINASGTPTVTTDLALTWDGLVRVNRAAGLGGDDLPPGSVQVATASGVDWVAAPVPLRTDDRRRRDAGRNARPAWPPSSEAAQNAVSVLKELLS